MGTFSQSDGPRRFTKESELNSALGITPEGVADDLRLTGPLRSHFLRNAASRDRSIRALTRELGLIDALATHPNRPYGPLHDVTLLDQGERRAMLRDAGQIRFEVRPEALQTDPTLFSAWFLDLPGALLAPREDPKSLLTHTLVMRLPWKDLDDLRHHVRPSHKPCVVNGFGFIAYTISTAGQLRISTFRNDVYERITSDELREKYRAWPTLLLHALHYLVQLRPSQYRLAPGEMPEHVTPREIVFYPGSPEEELATMLEKLGYRAAALEWAECSPDDPNAHPVMRRQSKEEIQQLHQELPRALGYLPPPPWPASDDPEEDGRFIESGLVRRVAPLSLDTYRASDRPELRLFRDLPPSRLDEIEQYVASKFPVDWYHRLDGEGVALEHPAPPPLRDRALHGIEVFSTRFLRAPATPLPTTELKELLGAGRYERWVELRHGPAMALLTRLLGRDFTVVSQAAWGQANDSWWEIPQPPENGTTIDAIHLSAQNRHPSLRAVSRDTNGREQRIAIGFKGAGYLNTDGAELPKRPNGTIFPFERNELSDRPHHNPLKEGHPAPAPNLWGGNELTSAAEELNITTQFRLFLADAAPHLQELVPMPLDVREYLSIPYLDGGAIRWMGSLQFRDEHLGTPRQPFERLATYISASQCDVRLRQAVERIFTRSTASRVSLAVAQHEVESALGSIFWWNGENTELKTTRHLSDLPRVGTGDILGFLRSVSDADPARTERILDRSAYALSELLGLVHGLGGHFGGGYRRSSDGRKIGVSWGGPIALRNVDLCGGTHDYNLGGLFLFPWEGLGERPWNWSARQFAERDTSQKLDLMYLGETVYWMEKILRGDDAPSIGPEGTRKHCTNPLNEIVLLDAEDKATEGLALLSRRALSRELRIEEALGYALSPQAISRYTTGFRRGEELRSTLPE